ncbi:oligoendopeptidase F [Celeribacter ethanolicus]|uniref:Oligoendopeptidase F n=1 Tax=Celeribacter ethanolicus TaxID=1758178 RepID=A0A291GHB2_9RHOB|nr:M3 family oligoendopeptidase [Celeribacter ethanolicus]ATG49585.1 oligoendopeptidase F [Celeribacter ethanolicus]
MRFTFPQPVFDQTAQSGHNQFGDLPDWDLTDLYPSTDAPEVKRDLDWLEEHCASFAEDYEGKLAGLDGAGMYDCILRNERISQVAGRLGSFAGLLYYQNTVDGERAKFLSDIQDKITNFTAPLVFFSLEVNRIPEDTLEEMLKHDGLARYRPIFERMRKMRPYQLSDELERYEHDMSVVGASAWNKLFDETIADLKFEVNGETLGIEATTTLMTEQDRSLREAAAREIGKVLGDNIKIFSRVHNTLAKMGQVEDKWRGMPTPQTGRHLSNDVEPEVVQALRDAVVAAYPKLSHRYYELKRGWLGLDKLQVWDRNAPLPMEETRTVGWDEARKTVMDAYAGFDPRMAEIAEPFFTKGWIDAGVKPGKAPGAFAHPTVTDAHPYVMLNYLGKPRDVMTLAHELGHGVHQVLAAGQGELLADTPLTLAETASVFGEMLTFQKMLKGAKTDAERKVMLAGKVEDMINTVVRQIAFYDFECKLHEARKGGELTPQDINKIWMSVQGESLGPAFEFFPDYEVYWSYIPHFVHSPFYVYAYAFGDGLVNALYAAYTEQPEGFQDKYFDMLKSGGSKHHKELLKPFGLDASDPKFWDKGLSMISGFIDELEAME